LKFRLSTFKSDTTGFSNIIRINVRWISW